MGRIYFLAIFLFGCSDEMNIRKIIPYINSTPTPEIDWWLGGGLVLESTTYTIYDAIGASSQSNSYINLANPGTNNATPIVAPTWSANTGWTFNGTTQHLQTNAFLANSTLIIWYENWTGIYVCGNTKMLIRPIETGSTKINMPTGFGIAGESVGGIIAVRAGMAAYRNNIAYGNLPSLGAGTNIPLYIGARNNGSGADSFGGGRVYRYAHYDFKLSDAQVEAVIDAMKGYQEPDADPYEATVMSLNPICYYPCTQKYGWALYDVSGNNAPAQVRYQNVGQPGLKGLSISGTGSSQNFIETYTDWSARTGINMDEFSAMCWIKVQSDASNQIRVWNLWSNGVLEYAATEIRTGLMIGLFFKQTGFEDPNNHGIVPLTNNTWHLLIMYNSQTAGKYGIYLDGVKYDFNHPVQLTGFTDTSPDFGFPQMFHDVLGNIQHIAYFDHALSQSEVNTLYVP